MRNPFPPVARRLVHGCLFVAALAGSGCTFYHSLGKGQHLEAARPAPHHDLPKGGEDLLIEVTTNAEGAVSNIRFLKPSKSDAVNGYVSETIRSGWPPTPSLITVARLRHTPDGGFGQPETVSTAPAPAQ